MSKLLEISDLKITFESGFGKVDAVRGVNLAMDMGDAIAVVGASGSGKTVLGRSLLGLVDAPGIVRGSIKFGGTEIVGKPEKDLRDIRGLGIGMVFQDALDGLNPVYSIGSQLSEIFMVRLGMSHSASKARAIEIMEQVGIRRAAERYHNYPHQFSGGMRQRICIAMAIGMKPKILIADEPTTALDVTVQAGILRLIKTLQSETGMGLIFVTHDLAVARMVSTRIVVMYAGQIVEEGPTEEVFRFPKHPYTKALLAAHPARVRSWRDLEPIPEAFVTDASSGGEAPGHSSPSIVVTN
ncbi:peptide/nickel transport system ATP-binding protein/oligopeptide transport system ATP-binding protein [Neorhizobium sp. 2083]|uniref:ABC transporter ATP-binding protein n=1 Tax=Neorhizobium sp. 2083 TaxID=2817762 RepID=UPI000DDCC5B8|nr:ABC transporter ATP-binding protein [Neorhizobium sp. 2083]MDR6817420.1 peptide/nickel transport system ATP-binding protein/oligopeptide transport system ATP-binding protein [Neorhizobium sp. 2083]